MTHVARSSRRRQVGAYAARVTLLLLILTAVASVAHAWPVSAAGGYDYYDGVDGQITRGVVAAVGASFAGTQASLAGVRYDDSDAGKGTSITAGMGVPAGLLITLRAQATRFVGDGSHRAWRAKVGPQVGLPGGRTVSIMYSHYEDNQETTSNGAILETEIPLVEGLTARANASYATAQGVRGTQGAVGLGWKLAPHLELSGEVGVAQSGLTAASSPGPSRRLQLPLIGGGGSQQSSTQTSFSPTTLIGFRLSLP